MADPRAFLSFDFDHDLVPKILFAGQAKNDSPTPFTLQDWSSKSALPEAEWEALIAQKISATNMLIVLVGKSMGTATGVVKEIAMAIRADVPVFGVYVDGANASSTLPTGLQRNRTMDWSWPLIGAAIDQAMTLGKNAK
ncbi:TIR domain-containing protein [Arthrobacter sp. MSA 4-2]|uniref:TIR domain-containing protein n=1 Tax=Arthrobacter sp. MSA 4-2 TaxID=2794349 RepID=UPI0018E6F3B2|nr:TIR domain-containing protein [Arthrobacter sp. MSA 4-2]MBJ2120854.1 TIR domain-containing protein [Arthrobacter sp. MSA 4-2]